MPGYPGPPPNGGDRAPAGADARLARGHQLAYLHAIMDDEGGEEAVGDEQTYVKLDDASFTCEATASAVASSTEPYPVGALIMKQYVATDAGPAVRARMQIQPVGVDQQGQSASGQSG